MSVKRRWLIVAVALCAAALAVSAVITDGFNFASSAADASQERCESEVLKRLMSPTNARLTNVQAEKSVLDTDSRDLLPLQTNEPLKGVDVTRITVWNVSGVIEMQSEVGTQLHEPFDCRAYFVDGDLADTLVLLDHKH